MAVGPSWESLTNRDGTGLYHEILNEVFALYDIKVRREYVPSERAYDLVRDGRADFMTCHDLVSKPLVLARHPMFEGTYFVFFKKANIGTWKGDETLIDRTVAWRIGYYDQRNFPVRVEPKEVKTGEAALSMVILDRVDFYVDDMSFIETSIKNSTISFVPEEYDTKPVGRRTYHPVFSDSERGRTVMKLYDEGMETLYRNGELTKIFSRWGYAMPHYDVQ
ncbi:MAG: transporter substrate-binding domain-containing protein [Proteobacteria bacterium]|nr:transporter substrate-binding domain-containing protein [Pseudomonadota bacterium]